MPLKGGNKVKRIIVGLLFGAVASRLSLMAKLPSGMHMATCEVKIGGFIFARLCGQDASGECHDCSRRICDTHTAHVGDGGHAYCTGCWGGAG